MHRSTGTARERGSLQLDSSLVIGLLVLIAAVTLFSFGTAIACLFAKEASQVNRVSFYTTPPEVTTSTTNAGEVAFGTAGMAGPFTIMRGRPGPGNPGYNPSEVSTWDVLKENATSPATGLDVRDGDRVAIVADAKKCGFRLVGATWGGGGGGGGGGQSGVAWYAATTWTYPDAAGTGAETDYVSVHDGTGKQIWKDQAIVDGGGAYLFGVSVSDKSLYAYADPDDGTPGIYTISDWRDPAAHGELTLFLPAVVATPDGTAYEFNWDDEFRVSGDDSELVMSASPVAGGDPVLLAVDTATLGVRVVSLPGTPNGSAVYGLDNRAYALNADGELYRLGTYGQAPVQIGSSAVVGAGLDYKIMSVDAAGNVLLGSGTSQQTIFSVAPDGTASAMPDALSWWCINANNAFTPGSEPVLMDGMHKDANGVRYFDINHLRLASASSGTDIHYPFVEGYVGTLVYGLSSVMGNTKIGPPPPPPPPPPAGTWNYSVLVNGAVAYSRDFVPANPNSVTLNPIVPASAAATYGRDLGGGSLLQPFVRMVTDRTLDTVKSGRADVGRFSANAIRDGVPAAADGFISPFGTVSDPARTLLADGVSVTPGWRTHTAAYAPNISLIEHGDAHIAASGPTATLANNLCLSVTRWGETRAEEGAAANRRYSIGGSVFLPQAGEADPSRRILVQAPMDFDRNGFSVPDTLAGKSMADLSYQIAGISWDEGAESVPDFSLGFFGNDASFPSVGANAGRLVSSDGTVRSAVPAIMKGTVIEVRITGGTVKPTVKTWVKPELLVFQEDFDSSAAWVLEATPPAASAPEGSWAVSGYWKPGWGLTNSYTLNAGGAPGSGTSYPIQATNTSGVNSLTRQVPKFRRMSMWFRDSYPTLPYSRPYVATTGVMAGCSWQGSQDLGFYYIGQYATFTKVQARSAGWHQLQMVRSGESVDVQIDEGPVVNVAYADIEPYISMNHSSDADGMSVNGWDYLQVWQ